MPSLLTPGTLVAFDSYGATLRGTVLRDNGTGIIWVRPAGTLRQVWKHRASVNVL